MEFNFATAVFQVPSYIGLYGVIISHEIRIRKPEAISISWFMSANGFAAVAQLEPTVVWNSLYIDTDQGTIGCTPNSVPMVFIVFSRET